MAKGRWDLQPPMIITAAQSQDTRFAVRVPGGAKSGMFFVNVLGFSATTPTFKIFTATDVNLDPQTSSPSFWVPASTGLTVGGTGTVNQALTTIGEWLRWDWSGTITSIRFSVVVYTYDA